MSCESEHIEDQKTKNPLVPNPDVPLLTTGILEGMLMMPTRSNVGTRERKMARIRSASPLPALISWKR